jgi:signal transduction histidine kinase
MHGGHVKVESVLDEGTTFSVFLPVRAPVTAP